MILLGVVSLLGSGAQAAPPQRVISLDYCADQYVLTFVPRAHILAVSPDADAPFSYMRDAARGLTKIRPRAEDVLIAQPDLIVRSYGGGPNAAALFTRAGVPVLTATPAHNLAGVRQTTLDMAAALGQAEHGIAVVADMDRRLAALKAQRPPRTALYVTPSGWTSGPGSLMDAMLQAAGLANFQRQPGWRSLPLERLAYERPQLIAAAFFDHAAPHLANWGAMRHPVARAQIRDVPTVFLSGAWVACGGWFLVDAIEALAKAPAP